MILTILDSAFYSFHDFSLTDATVERTDEQNKASFFILNEFQMCTQSINQSIDRSVIPW